ncbi:MAG: hypothetical protein WAK91_13945 [Candidatus Acidiferrales bacterium]|jgi:hypothetical protein
MSTANRRNAISTSLILAVFVAIVTILFSMSPDAQGNTRINVSAQKEHEAPQHEPQDAVVTGCLHRRDKPGDFALTTRDTKLYYIESSTVDLAAHVGHTVTITGIFLPDKETKDDPDKNQEVPTISATKLEMIRKTCH